MKHFLPERRCLFLQPPPFPSCRHPSVLLSHLLLISGQQAPKLGSVGVDLASGLSKIVVCRLPLSIASSQGWVDLRQWPPCCGPDGLGVVIS